MEQNEKKNRSRLEFLIVNRAINYNKSNWLYLTTIQKILTLEVLEAMARLTNVQKDTALIDELIDETLDRVNSDKTLAFYKKKLNFSFSNGNAKKFSKDAVRTVIYMLIPAILNCKHSRKAKIISLTSEAKDFLIWKDQKFKTNKGAISKWKRWLSTKEINFDEDSFEPDKEPEITPTKTSSIKKATQKPNINTKKIVPDQQKLIKEREIAKKRQRTEKLLNQIISRARKEKYRDIEAKEFRTKELSVKSIRAIVVANVDYLKKHRVKAFTYKGSEELLFRVEV